MAGGDCTNRQDGYWFEYKALGSSIGGWIGRGPFLTRAAAQEAKNKYEWPKYNTSDIWLCGDPPPPPPPPPPPKTYERGYFEDGGVTFFSWGEGDYCGFLTPAHYRMHRVAIGGKSLGKEQKSDFGKSTGVCQVPAGYFQYPAGGTTYYSNGDGTYVAFDSPDDYARHLESRSWAANFGLLESPPDSFMVYKGIYKPD